MKKQADENYKFAQNQRLPILNLNLGYTSNGFAGTLTNSTLLSSFGPLPTVPSYLTGATGQSLQNLLDNRFPSYNVGLLFEAHIGAKTENADVLIAQEQENQAAIRSNGLTERIQAESINALQSYQSALSRLNAARNARVASEQVLSSEERKFRNGASTTFLVLQREVQLSQARGVELQAQTDLNKAVTEIQRVSGDILPLNGVNLK